jgi:hypothetical protein
MQVFDCINRNTGKEKIEKGKKWNITIASKP